MAFDFRNCVVRIGIVGAGISGLSAALELCEHHEVVLFESADYAGGHTNTIRVVKDGLSYEIDTGFIVFNFRTYPNFTKLLERLGVESKPTEMTFSVKCAASGLEYRGADLPGLFAQKSNLFRPSFYRMLSDILRFNRQATLLYEGMDETLTVGDFFREYKYSNQFIEQYFLPMGSAVWSCPRETFAHFPMKWIIDFFRNHGMLSVTDRPGWRVIQGGSRQYVTALLKQFRGDVVLGCRVENVVRTETEVVVQTSSGRHELDHLIFACHSDQALRILGQEATPVERDILTEFPYEENVAVLHTDVSVLPRRRRAWAAWNYSLPSNQRDKATVTYNMNLLQGIESPQTFCVTLNSEEQIDPSKIIRRIVYHHPIFTARRSHFQRRHHELIGGNRTSFCGAYWGNGFHEDGVNSALAVCRLLKGDSWKAAYTKVGSGTADSIL
jgi:uncharacterized protein